MNHKSAKQITFSRRDILTRILPGCALMCAGGLAYGQLNGNTESKTPHKFLKKMDRGFTPKQLSLLRYRSDFIPTMKLFQEYLGEKKLIELLKKSSSQRNFDMGGRFATFRGNNDFSTFVEPMRNLREMLANTISREIIEDSPNAFEMKVTECLTADIFMGEKAADIGFACVCYADFALPTGFNPRIKLVRNKTIMEGHPVCNHRYILT